MISKKYFCTKCNSDNIVKNGTTKKGKQKFKCNDCGSYGTLDASAKYTEDRKEEIMRAYEERQSMRGIERTFGVARQTLSKWLKKRPNNA